MASINELNISGFAPTGQNTPIPRYSFTLHIKYTLDDGVLRTYGPTTHTWPNDLTGIPVDVQQKMITDIIAAKAKVTLGAATWDEYR